MNIFFKETYKQLTHNGISPYDPPYIGGILLQIYNLGLISILRRK
jgi:hypothetical protein